MSRLDGLIRSYRSHVSVPWQSGAAPAQRVIICVYQPEDELRFRARITELEIATREAGHEWCAFDLTESFSRWLSVQRYARRYFQDPCYLPAYLPKYLDHIAEAFGAFLEDAGAGPGHVAAVYGVGTLFGILKVREVIDRLAPLVAGRLLVLFPGSYESNNYRLLDGYDGWNYLAVPITAADDI
jgi:hypothetical protein